MFSDLYYILLSIIKFHSSINNSGDHYEVEN
jgi:hypothetical protein